MGYYIETASPVMKANQLERFHGAERLEGAPESIDDLPDGKVLVCVVKNGPFDAAAIVYSDNELAAFNRPDDPRYRDWMLMNYDTVVELQPFAKSVL